MGTALNVLPSDKSDITDVLFARHVTSSTNRSRNDVYFFHRSERDNTVNILSWAIHNRYRDRLIPPLLVKPIQQP